jgi:hypothetical protein
MYIDQRRRPCPVSGGSPALNARPLVMPSVYTRGYHRPNWRGARSRGMGAAITGGAATADQIASAGAASTISMLIALGTVTGPVGAAIAGLVGLASLIASQFGGCGQTCIEATTIANQLGDTMSQALHTYMASPIHYQSMQTAYLNLFDTSWAALLQACGNPALGAAGQACISDRQSGACKWKSSPGGWQQQNGAWVYVWAGPAGSGDTCWNYFDGMRDPVANDPTVVSDPSPGAALSTAAGGVLSSLGVPASSNLSSLLLPAGLVAAVLFLL